MTFAERVDVAIRQAADWFASRRWYGDKARAMTAVTPEVVVPIQLPMSQAALAIARFSYERGEDARYFVPLVASPAASEDGPAPDLGDALRDAAFLEWFMTGFDDRRELRDGGTWRWRAFAGDDNPLSTVDAGEGRVLSGEQSNTSVAFGDRAVAKLFRRLQEGLNPDLEVGEFLTTHGPFPHAPRIYGVVDVARDGQPTAIAAIQQFVPNRGDGWEWMLERLEHLDAASRGDTIAAVRLLGQRTGELHVALASDPDDAAFAPEPFDVRDARELNARVVAEMGESVEGLARHIAPAEVEAMHKGIGRLMAHAHALVGTQRIRVHGDYHLGQTLRTLDNDFSIIDFEGEPSRPIAQRRAKQSALKDVAGMVRSLDYAVATVAGRIPERHDLLRDWLSEAERGYIDAYREAVSAASVPLVPEDDERFRQGLDLLIAEKALYEARYELNNRPDWLEIPLNALRSLAAREGR